MEVELLNLFNATIRDFATERNLRVQYPNVDFKSSGLSTYLRVSILPTDPQVLTVCGSGSRHIWVMQVSVYVKDGDGPIPAFEIVDQLSEFLPVTTKLVGVNHTFQVVTPPSPVPPIPMDGWFSVPVQFRIHTIK